MTLSCHLPSLLILLLPNRLQNHITAKNLSDRLIFSFKTINIYNGEIDLSHYVKLGSKYAHLRWIRFSICI